MAFVPVTINAADFNGSKLAGAKLYLYAAGTTTPQAGYRDATGGTAHTNPVICNAGGAEVVWLNDALSYKLILRDSGDSTTYFSQDNINPAANPTGVIIYPATQGDQSLRTTDAATFASQIITTDSTVGRDLAVTRDATVGGTLTVTGDAEFLGDLTLSGLSITSGDLNLSGDLVLAGDTEVTGTMIVPTPDLGGQAANKGYVDAAIGPFIAYEQDILTLTAAAELAKDNAEIAETLAEQWANEAYNTEVTSGRYSAFHYSTVASQAQTAATTAQTAAETAQAAAETAQTAAETAEANAATSQSAAETAETNASASASLASTSATTATTQAGIATTKATEASAARDASVVAKDGSEANALVAASANGDFRQRYQPGPFANAAAAVAAGVGLNGLFVSSGGGLHRVTNVTSGSEASVAIQDLPTAMRDNLAAGIGDFDGGVIERGTPVRTHHIVESIATAPPGSPTEGARYLVAASGTSGDFVGQENKIAVYVGAAWQYLTPVQGWTLYNRAVKADLIFDEMAWDRGASTGLTTYATIAQLTAASTNDVSSGDLVYVDDDRRGGLFRWDASNLSTEVGYETSSYVGVYYAPDSTDGSSGAWVREAFRTLGHANIEWFGAVPRTGLADKTSGTAATDSKAAIQAAFDFATAGGARTVYVPPTSYGYRAASALIPTGGFRLLGEGAPTWDEGQEDADYSSIFGSWILFDHAGVGITWDADTPTATNRYGGIEIDGVYFMRDQAAPTSSYTPASLGYDLLIESGDVWIKDGFHLNPTLGVRVRGSGKLRIDRLRGQSMQRLLYIERIADLVEIGQIHQWPYWSESSDVTGYQIDNNITLVTDRCDGLKINTIFSLAHHRIILMSDVLNLGSSTAGFSIDFVYSDKAGGGIEIISENARTYGQIKDFLHNADPNLGGAGDAFHLHGATAANVDILGMEVTRCMNSCVRVDGAAHKVTLLPKRFTAWNMSSGGHAMIDVDDGAVVTLLKAPDNDASGTLYSEGTSGSIIFPLTYNLGSSVSVPTGLYSRRVTIADDGVAVIAMPSTDKMGEVTIVPTSFAVNRPCASFYVDAGASPTVQYAGGTTGFGSVPGYGIASAGTVLTGTTATDTNTTVSSDNAGNFYIENRSGASTTYIVTILGN